MASPCAVITETRDSALAHEIFTLAITEVRRIEHKFSRYRSDSILAYIHRHPGRPVSVDAETGMMLDFAHKAWQLSHGLFDVTSGLLRKIWTFDGSDRIPSRKQAKALLPYIGWHKVTWQPPSITLPCHMELDFGGFGKEYAADRAIELIRTAYDLPVMVNLGGDLRVSRNLRHKPCWEVMIAPTADGKTDNLEKRCFQLQQGAVVTSGNTHRFLLRNGVRYSHILNPRTGWPVSRPPASVTVGGKTCLEAGLMATLAMLQGRKAAAFLAAQGVKYWVQYQQ